MASSVNDFIIRHRELLAKERQAEIDRTSLLISNCGPRLLEQKGLALGGLGIANVSIGLGGKTLIELEQPTAYHSSPLFPPHTFRPGDLACIESHVSANSAPSKKPKKATTVESRSAQVEGVVYKISDSRIVIAVDSTKSEDTELELPERCRVLKLANSVTYDRMEKTLEQLESMVAGKSNGKSVPHMTPLAKVLLAQDPPSEKYPVTNITFFDPNLNDSQKEAVKFALESPEVACIHGPPGTGKTHTLIEIVRQLTSVSAYNPKSLRLLICGASNLSVDNILERLLALPATSKESRLKVTRIGHPARMMYHEGVLDSTLDVKASRTDQAALTKDIKNELDATLGTLSGKGKGAKGKGPRGAERKKMWEDVRALRKEYRQREKGIVTSVLNDSQVVLATCHSSGGRQLYSQEFDVVIIDEATQALEVACWIPIFKAKKLILAGDPMQLPPTILSLDQHPKKEKSATKGSTKASTTKVGAPSELAADGSEGSESEDESPEQPSPKTKDIKQTAILRRPRTLETTLFDRLERMYGKKIKRMLQVQYRMHSDICHFPSKTLYGSKLKSDSTVASHLLADLPNANARTEEDTKEFLGTPIVFYDTAGCEFFERLEGDGDEGSRCNENEVTIVKTWVEQLVEMGIRPEQISVITPYQAQVGLLASTLRPVYGQAIEIGTVDGMQGREKDAVVISLVRSNDKREVGFLKDKRRLNVAMTRARRSLCIIGDSSTVSHGGPFLEKWMTWLEANADVRYAGPE